jgi:ATF/CREB family transcription factor
MAHKECPITQQQGGPALHQMIEGYGHNGQMNPYGMAVMNAQQQQQMMAGQNMQRRYS